MKCSQEFDLGLDRVRMKDPRDVARQHATVDVLLHRLFAEDPATRKEIQIVADEVGMGKTFVALGAAYSLLAAMKANAAPADLAGCYTKVLIITPTNRGLFDKWSREVGEFVKRCVHPEHRREARTWFAADRIERWDEVAVKLRRRGAGAAVLVGQMSLFNGGKVTHYDLKRRYLLGLLFKHWGTRLKTDDRARLLKGAPPGWPKHPAELLDLTDGQRALIPLGDLELRAGIEGLDKHGELEELLEACKAIAAPYVRDRDERFKKIEKQLMTVYGHTCWAAIRQAIPLVIVDEAHHWKNGPSTGTNGFSRFVETIACNTRRAMLLTATPFQLRPGEMLELFKVSDHLAPAPTAKESAARCEALKLHRTDVLAAVLRNSEHVSREFSESWSRIPRTVTTQDLSAAWDSAPVIEARRLLRAHAAEPGVIDPLRVSAITKAAVAHLDPSVREIARLGLLLFVANTDLSSELATIVIRHRRHTQHRAFLVGSEYERGVAAMSHRQDRNVLHGALGMDVEGDGELPHYLLMRCVSEMKQGKGRSSLGTALTGCYSTLLHSAEGKRVSAELASGSLGAVYFEALRASVGEAQDPQHPKVRRVVDAVAATWERGEKSLIFCFRVNTAHRLKTIIEDRLRANLDVRRERCLGGASALKTLKGRITRRDGDLVGLGLDRVLYSLYWASNKLADALFDDDLALTDDDLKVVAEMSLRFDVDILEQHPDRVFIHRAVEHALAMRLSRARSVDPAWKQVLETIADPSWVSHPYGMSGEDSPTSTADDAVAVDEQGVHRIYTERTMRPSSEAVRELAGQLHDRRTRLDSQDRVAIFDQYERGPSLWFGTDPSKLSDDPHRQLTVRRLHAHLRDLTFTDGRLDWRSRQMTFKALRRAMLRESVLLRILPDRSDLEEESWGTLLAERFYSPLPFQNESFADRVTVFVEDLAAASGSLGTDATESGEGNARFDMYEAAVLRDGSFVAVASGGTDHVRRNRLFAGFNSPLLPEILICTSVGQEGIDLHRHCRHVIHYDLAWNPAVLEQRTGRTDRIGSMTFRERRGTAQNGGPYLEVGVPFLAGTYDERMYEELRLRAQTFEILTGGDLSADNPEGHDHEDNAEGTASDLRLIALPDDMLAELRVRLHVWE